VPVFSQLLFAPPTGSPFSRSRFLLKKVSTRIDPPLVTCPFPPSIVYYSTYNGCFRLPYSNFSSLFVNFLDESPVPGVVPFSAPNCSYHGLLCLCLFLLTVHGCLFPPYPPITSPLTYFLTIGYLEHPPERLRLYFFRILSRFSDQHPSHPIERDLGLSLLKPFVPHIPAPCPFFSPLTPSWLELFFFLT